MKDTNGDALGYFPKTPTQYAAAGKIMLIKNKTLYTLFSMEVILTCN